ncbi:MAG TPA: thioesterase family protein [Magnetospirillaceae bacterium]|nr:thioesterase family protein [Magnetospirillaceae bacterium]
MSRFTTSRILRFGDCDPAGIAYFPSYFHFLNGVMEEWWGELGFPWRDLFQKRKIGLPTVQLDTQFLAPGFMGDELTFALEITALGSRSLTVQHVVSRDATLLWRATQTVVATSLDTHGSIAWPDDIRAALRFFQEAPAHV